MPPLSACCPRPSISLEWKPTDMYAVIVLLQYVGDICSLIYGRFSVCLNEILIIPQIKVLLLNITEQKAKQCNLI